jgi:hypothetical protein
VAHGCLWELHPDKAAAWEARLVREHGAGRTIDEPGAHAHRARASSPRAKRSRTRTPLAREE